MEKVENMKTCCVTGHRDIPEDKIAYVEAELRKEVELAINDGYTRFLSGFAEGVDLIFASIVAQLKEENPDLYLEADIPYPGRLKTQDALFQDLRSKCNDVKVICEKWGKGCYFKRNRHMVWQSERLIAVFDGRSDGGTLFTLDYAKNLGKEVHIINI